MAHRNTVSGYLHHTIGIAHDPTRDALLNQGLDDFAHLRGMKSDDIKNICATVRKPGGTIPNPLAVAGPAGAGQPPTIPNPGHSTVGYVFERHLKQLVYEINHCDRIHSPFEHAQSNLNRLRQTYRIKEEEEKRGDDLAYTPDHPEKCTKVEQVHKSLEDLNDWVLSSYGVSGLPLAYVLRDTVELPENTPNEADPGYGRPTRKEEMIRRAPHTGEDYGADNRTVWACVRHMFYDGPAKNWIKEFARAQDGRGAVLSIKQHFLGTGYHNRVKTVAQGVIDNTAYHGFTRNFTFEKYLEKLAGAFVDMEAHGEPVVTAAKIRAILKGIKAKYMEAAVHAVRASAHYMQNYGAAVDFLAAAAADHESRLKDTRRVSSEQRSGGRGRGHGGRFQRGGGRGRGRGGRGRGQGGRGRGGGGVDRNDPGRRYSHAETRRFTQEDWDAVRAAREAQGIPTKRTAGAAGIAPQEQQGENEGPQVRFAEGTTGGVGNSLKRGKKG